MHLEVFLEEPSAEAFLQGLLPKVLPGETTWNPIVFQGKSDLLKNLGARLKGYRRWLPADWRIVVLIDRDGADCRTLKAQLEAAAAAAGLRTKTTAKGEAFVVLNRIAVEELEAWFFGDPAALAGAYPGVSPTLGDRAKYRRPDAITGGTWEALEAVLQRAGYYGGGLPKIEVAREMGGHLVPARNTSPSFRCFVAGLTALRRDHRRPARTARHPVVSGHRLELRGRGKAALTKGGRGNTRKNVRLGRRTAQSCPVRITPNPPGGREAPHTRSSALDGPNPFRTAPPMSDSQEFLCELAEKLWSAATAWRLVAMNRAVQSIDSTAPRRSATERRSCAAEPVEMASAHEKSGWR